MEYAFVRKHGILDKIIASQLDKLQAIELFPCFLLLNPPVLPVWANTDRYLVYQ